jgi:DNA polymerase-3 subunit delta
LLGDTARVARIADGLRAEGEDPVLALWSLTRDVRTLVALAREYQQGVALPALLGKYRIWDKRKVPFEKALRRYNAARWQRVLQRCGRVDRVIKGREAGNAWDELLELAVLMSGAVLFEKRNSGAR